MVKGTQAQSSAALKPSVAKRASPMPPNQPKPPAGNAQPSSYLLSPYPRPSGLTPAQFTKLQNLCGPRWIDLLTHLPTRVLDRSNTPPISAASVGEVVTLVVQVIRRPPAPPKHIKRPIAIELADSTGTLRAVFFHPGAWLERAFPVGHTVVLAGKIESDAKGKKIIHPDVWNISQTNEENQEKRLEFIARVWPLYPLTAGLGQGWLARTLQTALTTAAAHPLPEWLPAATRERLQLPTFLEALHSAHHPSTEADLAPLTPARQRLALDELFATQLALAHARATTRSQRGLAHGHYQALSQKMLAQLPFPLTGAQTQALAEIQADLTAPRPMLRLLQGDVGSGKTLVALLSLLHVIENGHQGVLMAPTEILAQQLYTNARKYLEPLGITIGLLTGSLPAAQKKRLKQHVKEGFVQLLIGTHALTEDDVVFDKLGLAVIDEQHRFGVRQRLALSVNQPLPPDVLIMTATPIPRTLALTAYGDMDVAALREKPPGRTPIHTAVLPDDKVPEVAERLRHLAHKGQQAYWICPLVEETENTPESLTAATTRHQWLQQFLGDKIKVGLLHGKLSPAEKSGVMAAFQANQLHVLVSTTVVEVGVDVPNATVIVIEHAERFGLAQLHQLRGRVGRGQLASHCLLLYTAPLSPYAQARLQALRDSEDGFYLAEKDLELRGPGEVLGSKQAGEISMKLADLHHHAHLIPVARQLAEAAIAHNLPAAQRNALATLLEVFQRQSAAHWLRGG